MCSSAGVMAGPAAMYLAVQELAQRTTMVRALAVARALGSAEGDCGRGASGNAAVDCHSAHSQLGSGLSLPGGHPAAVRERGACWLVP